MNKTGKLVIISGFAGAGKGTIVKGLLKNYPEQYAISVSATTRAPREGERDGIEYFFISEDEFVQWIENEKLLEYARYVNNYYGTPRDWVMEQMQSGKNVILEIEQQGAFQVAEKYKDALLIFVVAPSFEEVRNRLVGRGTETEEQINQRLKRAHEELADADKYNFVIVNDIIEKSIDLVHNIVVNF
ncbi:MAG: guanylate kinase [Parasporobacterium sp.]|nr:guanylate kinase [Parasporobacterium sp.]